ncbi:hypothetical protein E1A91_A03G132300v1 [Gossypium mustelinum]|uniref:Uncharacterized protein n=1 Tax=Gossypium mustelinum TaxID=34275 RepID=A0A5D2ZWT3_GOSMU|nr:hypothetical protein E1A91_A03G132300v1 [Gossypium mustelinum]
MPFLIILNPSLHSVTLFFQQYPSIVFFCLHHCRLRKSILQDTGNRLCCKIASKVILRTIPPVISNAPPLFFVQVLVPSCPQRPEL